MDARGDISGWDCGQMQCMQPGHLRLIFLCAQWTRLHDPPRTRLSQLFTAFPYLDKHFTHLAATEFTGPSSHQPLDLPSKTVLNYRPNSFMYMDVQHREDLFDHTLQVAHSG
jgi:hypothetical protein